MADDAAAPSPEFSRPVATARLGEAPALYRFAADPQEREALARRLGLLALDRLEIEARLSRAAGGGIRLAGQIAAELVQECVVTLEPVPSRVAEDFVVLYRREAPHGEIVDPGEEDIESLDGDEIDLGEAAAQQLSLAIDPYPRAPGAALSEPPPSSELSQHPFAGLAKLAKG